MTVPLLSAADLAALAPRLRRPYHEGYLAMYSSRYGGIVTDPLLMTVPLDDHMVHRGDGVFEALKCVGGNLYNFGAHLARLMASAETLDLNPPWTAAELSERVCATVRAGGAPDAVVRLFVSRGAGGFGVSPYESERPELYIVVTRLPEPFMRRHPGGARAVSSRIPPKDPFFARIKSCNYLPNVLMKKEAQDAGVDFVFSFDARGHLGEGATETVGIVTPRRELLCPRLEGILKGTTMMRVMDLARALVKQGKLRSVAFADVPRARLASASEILVVGTTLDVVAVVEYDGNMVGEGVPGAVYAMTAALLEADMREHRGMLTPVFETTGRHDVPGGGKTAG
jgi:branched-chain amino acid aminotransferase